MSAIPDGDRSQPPGDGTSLPSETDRAAAFSAPRPTASRRFIASFIGVVLILGLGGGFLDNVLTAHGITTGHPSSPTSSGATTLVTLPAKRLSSSIASLMGISAERGPAPGFSLTNQSGTPVSLASLRNKVVVLSFFDPACNDICPVLASELQTARRDLGAMAVSVAFVTVDPDPLSTSLTAAREAGIRSGLAGPKGLAGWQYLTGPLSLLDKVWVDYGISVDVQPTTGRVVHSDLLWFISPSGRLAYRATPFANEARGSGTFTLAASERARFGAGIATYASRLIPAARASS